MPRKSNLEAELQNIRRQELERKTQRDAARLGLPYLDLTGVPIQETAFLLVPEEEARKGEFFIFRKKKGGVGIITTNPENTVLQEALRRLREKYVIELFFVSRYTLDNALAQYAKIAPLPLHGRGVVEISSDLIKKFEQEIKSVSNLSRLIGTIDISRVSESVEIFLAAAIKLDASDIHVEPQQNRAKIRFRVDGLLEDVGYLPTMIFEKILSRIKVVSGLKLNIRTIAQDGRFSVMTDGLTIEVRVSTVPSEYGESIVLRILNPQKLISFEELGLRPHVRAVIEYELSRPTGMILVTGPTGSGKTTTLYAFLKKLVSPTIKIITIEDPIEYRIEGVSQTQVSPRHGYTFAEGLRSIVRQDPDAILVGEMRDIETAEVGFHAALTGHLVFSTLHTNDAVGAVPRLIDIGIRSPVIAPALNVVVAQRLIRKVCNECVRFGPPSQTEKVFWNAALKTIPKTFFKSSKILRIPRPRGCAKCNQKAYRGRTGIFEVFQIDRDIEALILKEPSVSALHDIALKRGMLTIQQDALLKVLEGITTLEEVERVTGKIESSV